MTLTDHYNWTKTFQWLPNGCFFKVEMNVRQPSYSQREPATSGKRVIFHLRMKIDCRHKSQKPTSYFHFCHFIFFRLEKTKRWIHSLFILFVKTSFTQLCLCVCVTQTMLLVLLLLSLLNF
jgi:hypothetical protein